jgi:hypothetical protein
VPNFEKKKRGCIYCKHVVKKKRGKAWRANCPFDECPYHVLDGYKTFDEFMASEDSRIQVAEFFQTVPSVYELGSSNYSKPKWLCSDGDQRNSL